MLTPKVDPFYLTKDEKPAVRCPACGASSNDHGIYRGGQNIRCTKCHQSYSVKKGLEK